MGKRRCRAKWRWTEWEGIRGARQLGRTLDAYPYLLLLTFSSLPSPYSKSPLTRANLHASNNVTSNGLPLPQLRIKSPLSLLLYSGTRTATRHSSTLILTTPTPTRNHFSHENPLPSACGESNTIILSSNHHLIVKSSRLVVNLLTPKAKSVSEFEALTFLTPLSRHHPRVLPASSQHLISA